MADEPDYEMPLKKAFDVGTGIHVEKNGYRDAIAGLFQHMSDANAGMVNAGQVSLQTDIADKFVASRTASGKQLDQIRWSNDAPTNHSSPIAKATLSGEMITPPTRESTISPVPRGKPKGYDV